MSDASLTPEKVAFDHVADYALGLILDDQRLEVETSRLAAERLGRKLNADDPEGDPAWWEAKTIAINELIDRMRAINNIGEHALTHH